MISRASEDVLRMARAKAMAPRSPAPNLLHFFTPNSPHQSQPSPEKMSMCMWFLGILGFRLRLSRNPKV